MNFEKGIGEELYDLAGKIFPICRSITGDGVRETLGILNEYLGKDGLSFEITEVPSGSKVLDWTVPKEWRIRDAYVADESGKRVIDFQKNNLHVVGYSLPMDEWLSKEELGKIIYTQKDQPDVIPYVTSYYKERSGFCISQKDWDALSEQKYHVVIDSELFDGSLTYTDLVIPGVSEKEILITSYTCHPSMANNECSGPVLLVALARYVNSLKDRQYTYRFVLNPETIGSITYLSRNLEHLKKNVIAGVVLSCVGDDHHYSMIASRYANTLADKALETILCDKENYEYYSFLKRGSDERQYNAPGIELPVVGFCRSKYGEFPEYHTSADNMSYVSAKGFEGSFEVMKDWINCLEWNGYYRMTVLGEPQLGKRGLYPTVSQKGSYDGVMAMMNLITYCDGRNDLFDLSDLIDVAPQELIPIVQKLLEHGLLEKIDRE